MKVGTRALLRDAEPRMWESEKKMDFSAFTGPRGSGRHLQ